MSLSYIVDFNGCAVTDLTAYKNSYNLAVSMGQMSGHSLTKTSVRLSQGRD